MSDWLNRQKPKAKWLRALTVGSPHPLREVICVLSFYVDPTKDAKNIVVCGLLAHVDAWDAFYPQWNAVLAIEPALPFWHAADAWAGEPPFDVLDRGQREAREQALARIILQMGLPCAALSVVMHCDTFTTLVKDRMKIPRSAFATTAAYKRAEDVLTKWEYTIGIGSLLGLLVSALGRSGIDENVRVVVESENLERDAFVYNIGQSAMRLLAQMDDPKAGAIKEVSVAKGKDPLTRPLEAIDLYAWCRRRILSECDGPDVISLADQMMPPAEEYVLTPEKVDERVLGFLRDTWTNQDENG
jgi:hypothetical protein